MKTTTRPAANDDANERNAAVKNEKMKTLTRKISN